MRNSSKVKTLYNNPNERSHRNHRSKKNRKHVEFKDGGMAFKRKKRRIREREMDDSAKSMKRLVNRSDKYYT